MQQCPYSKHQISQYLNHIGFLPSSNTALEPKPNLSTLERLQRHHLATFPFENLDLHYSTAAPPRQVSLDPADLFDKFVIRGLHGRGGCCVEQNAFFLYVLRALGFDAYSAGARVQRRSKGKPSGEWTGWAHMVNIVTIAEDESGDGGRRRQGEEMQRWVVDVGFGGNGPTKPLRLVDGYMVQNLGVQQVRLIYDRGIAKGQPMWVYQVCNGPVADEGNWQPWYCFTEVEFLPQDFEIMSYWVCTNPHCWFGYDVVTVKMVLDADAETIVGKLTLYGAEVKRIDGTGSVLVKTCQTEQERVDVLREMFGMTFTAKEVEGIKSTASALAEKIL